MLDTLKAAFANAPTLNLDTKLPEVEAVAAVVPASEKPVEVLACMKMELQMRRGRQMPVSTGYCLSVVTDKNIYFVTRGGVTKKDTVEIVPPHTITGLTSKEMVQIGFGGGKNTKNIEITRAANVDKLRGCDPAQADKWVAAVRALMSQSSSGTTTIVNEVDPLDQLKKLKDLLDAGVLSQSEFDAKKTEIMGKI